jgi:predicted amidohydrolase YtcJ
MKRWSLGTVLLSLPHVALAASAEPPADLVLLHGRIHTEDPNRSVAQALAVRGDMIVAVGSDADVSAFVGPQTHIVDLRGRVVLPGIIDAHIHPAESDPFDLHSTRVLLTYLDGRQVYAAE